MIDLITHRSFIRSCGQPVYMQIFHKNPQMIWLLIELLSKSAIILFIHKSFKKIQDQLNHLQEIFFNDL